MTNKNGLVSIERAVFSVFDKACVVDFAYQLSRRNLRIASTGGTARAIKERVPAVEEISDLTGFPECMDGRVKTLHPLIMGGILADRDKPSDTHVLHNLRMSPARFINETEPENSEHRMFAADLVVVNLYDFEATIARTGTTLKEAVEKIDIGGNTMIRAAVKNWEHVAVVVNPEMYGEVIEEMRRHDGCLTRETRFRLAQKAFDYTSGVDVAINKYLMLAR